MFSESIHELWKLKFKQTNKELEHFFSGNQISKLNRECLLLCDYEFISSTENGLDIIERLNHKNAALVTSHFENKKIQDRAKSLAVKIIPKSIVSHIPIKAQQKYKDIVIDDDDLIRLTCGLEGSACFETIESFIIQSEDFPKNVPIYIDEMLGTKSGTKEARKIADLGFTNINIRTGLPEGLLNKPEYINQVISK